MKKILELTDEQAKKLYPTADKTFKELLEANWSKDFFLEKITDRVRNFEDACRILKLDPEDVALYDGDNRRDPDEKAQDAFVKLITIARALNEDWKPDWNNSSQYKWFCYFDMRSGFSFLGVNYWITARSNVGSRLCFKTRELAEYFGKQFLEIHKTYMVIPA